MKVLVILTLDLDNPEDLPKALEAIDPSTVFGFEGQVRVCIDSVAESIEEYLDQPVLEEDQDRPVTPKDE